MPMNADRTTNQSLDLSHAVPSKIQSKKKSLITQEDIRRIEERKKEEIIFSWRLFDRNHKLFNLGKTEASWFISLVDCLRDVSKLTVSEFRQQSKRRGLRVHPHDWENASAKFNMTDEFFDQNEENCLQFSVSKAKGRVHGILIDNIFYIVWLDPHHNLYPPKERNRKVYEPEYPVTDYEILQYEKNELEEELEKIKEDLKTCEQLLDECT